MSPKAKTKTKTWYRKHIWDMIPRRRQEGMGRGERKRGGINLTVSNSNHCCGKYRVVSAKISWKRYPIFPLKCGNQGYLFTWSHPHLGKAGPQLCHSCALTGWAWKWNLGLENRTWGRCQKHGPEGGMHTGPGEYVLLLQTDTSKINNWNCIKLRQTKSFCKA